MQDAFDFVPPLLDMRTISPTGAPTAAAPRLSAQSAAILSLLRERPRSNAELSRVALKYTSRISDIRAAGYRVEAFNQNHVTGEAWYRLVEDQ